MGKKGSGTSSEAWPKLEMKSNKMTWAAINLLKLTLYIIDYCWYAQEMRGMKLVHGATWLLRWNQMAQNCSNQQIWQKFKLLILQTCLALQVISSTSAEHKLTKTFINKHSNDRCAFWIFTFLPYSTQKLHICATFLTVCWSYHETFELLSVCIASNITTGMLINEHCKFMTILPGIQAFKSIIIVQAGDTWLVKYTQLHDYYNIKNS